METALIDIKKKVDAGLRISESDAFALLSSNDLLSIGMMADTVRRRKNGDTTYYIVNRHINYTNVCMNGCKFCAFHKKPGDNGYTLSLDVIREKAVEGKAAGATEFHVVGGLNETLPFSFYIDMLHTLRDVDPSIHIQAFTVVELAFIAEIAKLPLDETIRLLKEAGLGSVPGGGAEIFHPDVRSALCEKKISGEEWLAVSRAVHKAGLHSNATMLFGHIERKEHIVDHMSRLRSLQDETKGFLSFIPLVFHSGNTEYTGIRAPTGSELMRMLAVSRIFLDNFPHIKSFWIMLGLKMAQLSQFFGVDDIDGTVTEEKITHAAGASTPENISRAELVEMIEGGGFHAVERDTLYRHIKR
ncbi:MAG: aminofutalosine synthase MqnE [Spirochaetes bacterium]|nr:aminofutalosine synthase MqnE [Spirochaetota bacterium]